ncbi:serine hydrolase domain-containing protein [Micropruina sp.]|uniref:serine hydrolase domain-containing protein n=1 Tax=Micropruina sp. TaxID=2737536 RepID=UPI0039E59A59
MRRGGRLWLRILGGVIALAMIALIGVYWYLRPLLRTGTGYAAHNACALDVIAHRSPLTADLPPNPLVPYLRVGTDSGGYQSTVLGVLAGQHAWPVEGFGCTLAINRPALGTASRIEAGNNRFAKQPTPQPKAALSAALAGAFGDDLDQSGRDTLGTRGVVVVSHGVIVAERYAPGFTASTPQLGWSMSKSATSLMLGRLVQQGLVSLDDDHLRPEWTDERATITIEDLLRMRSGLAWDETYDLGTPITDMLYNQADMATFVAEQKSAYPVGTVQQYSSGSTTLLCAVLNSKVNQGADLPRRQLLAPLGLISATWEADATGTPVCSSYLWATPRDWAAIGQFALNDGVWNGQRLLPEGWMKATTTTLPIANREDPNYAAGWWTNLTPEGTLVNASLPRDAYWASGHDGQKLYVVPSKQLVVVRLGFSPSTDDIRTDALVADVIAALGK